MVDPSGRIPIMCIHDAPARYTQWQHVDVVVTGTVSFTSPSPNATISATSETVTKIRCIYKRTVSRLLRCAPCAWTPRREYPDNSCTTRCNQTGEREINVVDGDNIDAEGVAFNWTPPWWPPGAPSASLSVFDFASDAAKQSAMRRCSRVALNFVAENAEFSSYPQPSAEVPVAPRPGCTTTCP